MAKKTPRPGRTLLIFGLAIVVLYGLAALGGTWKPRLGLDLEGGTRITLSAIEQGGQNVTQTKLKQAAEHRRLARERQRGLGGGGLHPGQPQHHRRDPRQERLEPRRLRQAHRPAALPHRGGPAAARPGGRPAEHLAEPESVGQGQPLREGEADADRQARQGHSRNHGPHRSRPPSPRRHRARPPRQPSTPAGPADHGQGRPRRPAAGLVAEPGRRVAAEVRRLPVPTPRARRLRPWRTTPTSR